MGETHLNHVGTGPCLLLCSFPTSFNNSSFVWELRGPVAGKGMLPHYCLVQNSRCTTVLDPVCCILHFTVLQIFSVNEKAGLQAGRSSSRTLVLWSLAVVTDAELGSSLFSQNMQGLLEKDIALKPVYTFKNEWCLSKCARGQFHRHLCTLYYQRHELLNSALSKSQVDPPLFNSEDTASIISPPKNNICIYLRKRIVFYVPSVLF